MSGRTCHLDFFSVLHSTVLKVVVLCCTMCIGVCSVESETFQGRGNETKISLVSDFYTEQIGIVRINGFRNFVFNRITIFI